MTNVAQHVKFNVSLSVSIALHLLVILLMVLTINHKVSKPPVMVSLQKNGKDEIKPIKAGVVDKRAIDQVIQRKALEEKQRQDLLIEEQRKAEQLIAEAEQAKALELANIQKAKIEMEAKKAAQDKARLAKEKTAKEKIAKDLVIKEQLKKTQAKQIADKKLLEKQQAEKKIAADKQVAADKQAAGLRAEKDRLQAEHNALLLSEVDKHKAIFAATIEDNRILSTVFTGDIKCTIRIRLLPNGSILSANIVQSSGNPAYDEMSQAAVYKSAPFPMPEDTELYDQLRDIILSFRNGEQAADA